MSKLKTLNFLEEFSKKAKAKGKKIALCHGVFDLLHPGHVHHINQAKKMADILIVSLTSDKNVYKGPGRPYFNQIHRLNSISSLEKVDYAVLSNEMSAVNIIKKIKPNFYVKGPDYKNFQDDFTKKINLESSEVKKHGGKIMFTTGITFSSSKILNEKVIYNSEQHKFIKNLKNKYGATYILKSFEKIFSQIPLVTGETIIDEYVFCSAVGKSGKDPYLVLQEQKTEKYLGGVLSIAQSLSAICKKVKLLSMIGASRGYENKIKNQLQKNIKYDFIKKKNSTTIIKKRFIEKVNNIKLLGVYSFNDSNLSIKENKNLISKFKKNSKLADLVILTDYGHGFFTKSLIREIYKSKKFLAVNAQVNSSSIGYHTIMNYKKADLILMNETELRQEFRDKKSHTFDLIKQLEKKINSRYIAITQGKTGAIIYNTKTKKKYHVPAFARNVVDKVGAGDALFSILSVSLNSKIQEDIAMYFASITAALNAENYANKFILNKNLFQKIIEHSLK